jgi:hypothetical protein
MCGHVVAVAEMARVLQDGGMTPFGPMPVARILSAAGDLKVTVVEDWAGRPAVGTEDARSIYRELLRRRETPRREHEAEAKAQAARRAAELEAQGHARKVAAEAVEADRRHMIEQAMGRGT